MTPILVKICSQISEISNIGYCLQALAIHSIDSIQSVQFIRSGSFRFRIDCNPFFLFFDSIGPISIRSVRFNPLNPIQSNRSGSFGPIRSDSIRFRIRYNAFSPIQIFESGKLSLVTNVIQKSFSCQIVSGKLF